MFSLGKGVCESDVGSLNRVATNYPFVRAGESFQRTFSHQRRRKEEAVNPHLIMRPAKITHTLPQTQRSYSSGHATRLFCSFKSECPLFDLGNSPQKSK